MPEWLRAAFEGDSEFRTGLLDKGSNVAADLEANPREVLGLSGDEMNARDLLWDEYDRSQGVSQDALSRLDGGFEDIYTDDVVNTTLAGMQRQADRDRLLRDSQAAAVGGTSNTRAAVGNAVADNLSGMSMAEMEAKLRSDATRFGAEMGLSETELMDQINSGMFGRGTTTSGALGAIAEEQRRLEQEQLDADRNAPMEATSWLADLFSGTQYDKGPIGGTTTSQQTGTGTETQPTASPFQKLLGIGASLGGAWLQSDEDVKEDIAEREGSALDALRDLRVAEYDYRDGYGHTNQRTTGLIAQDLEKAGITGAVQVRGGVRHVDPYAVLATVVGAVQELERKVA